MPTPFEDRIRDPYQDCDYPLLKKDVQQLISEGRTFSIYERWEPIGDESASWFAHIILEDMNLLEVADEYQPYESEIGYHSLSLVATYIDGGLIKNGGISNCCFDRWNVNGRPGSNAIYSNLEPLWI